MPALLSGCANPPQISAVAPGNGAGGVSTAQPIKITFNVPMNEASVDARFRLKPEVKGSIHWRGTKTLVFDHPTLRTKFKYQVILGGGYQDRNGTTNVFRHDWHFQTELAPTLQAATPGQGSGGIDPSTYLALTFSRPMNLSSLASAIHIGPSISFTLHDDPTNPARVLIAPQGLLYPNTSYSVTVSDRALDRHGNHLRKGQVTTFSTGARVPLSHWVSFATTGSSAGVGNGIWIVNDTLIPRRLVSGQVSDYSWSADGSLLLVRGQGESWSVRPVEGGSPTPLPFQAEWASFLSDNSYVYLEGGVLKILDAGGQTTEVASGVSDVAVDNNGNRAEKIAFVIGLSHGYQVEAYDAGLRSRYELFSQSTPMDQLSWAPNGQAVAYRLDAPNPAQDQIQVRVLSGQGSTVTLARGDVSSPTWQADSNHVFFQSVVQGADGTVAKIFQGGLDETTPAALSAGDGMPSQGGIVPGSFSVSPDGREIAFLTAKNGRTDLWWMNTDGTGLAQLAAFGVKKFPYSCTAVGWTPT
ncbi:MAG TPA: Ig-like domain-containing protein [Candidatus Dormibacteraeota bacterium]|nr:Ig-like domain-containing protein [Candidatus Dormibacteraeota bacterium]